MTSEAYNMDCMEFCEGYIAFKDGNIFSKKIHKFLKPIHGKNYDTIMIDRKTFYVHRIVASCFLENSKNLPCVNHIDGNKRNNAVENLEWVTYSENLIHAYKTRLNKKERPVIRTSDSGEIKRYRSAREAEKEGFSNQLIARCCKGYRKTHKGFSWRYEDAI